MTLEKIYDSYQNTIEEIMDNAFNSILEEMAEDESFITLSDDERYELVYDLMKKYCKG